MRTVRLILLLLLATVAFGNLIARAQTPEASAPTYLFVQQAAGGTLTPSGTGFDLTLEDASPHTVFFTDRPFRQAGTVPTSAFVALDDLFDSANAPNAAIVLAEPDSEAGDVLIVELFNPTYDAQTGSLRYELAVIETGVTSGLSSWIARADTSLPAAFGHVTLFIDSGSVFDPCNFTQFDDNCDD